VKAAGEKYLPRMDSQSGEGSLRTKCVQLSSARRQEELLDLVFRRVSVRAFDSPRGRGPVMWGGDRALDGTAFRVPDVFGWVTQGRSADGPTPGLG
jgi:hypothetical protein